MSRKNLLFEEINDDFRMDKIKAGGPGGPEEPPDPPPCDTCCPATWSNGEATVEECCFYAGESL